MAGITDAPFRRLCRRLGAGMAVSEMVTSDPALLHSRKTRLRLDHDGEDSPTIIQIAGADPAMLAVAARYNADRGAEIIDINMGCPARKVCNRAAGSALLKDERLVGRILDRVVNAVNIPVTLKIRTGWDANHKNAPRIARLAEQAGIQALTVHGRTRACGFKGDAEHDTVRDIKRQVRIPVIANGDIRTPRDAARVLAHTGADGIMIGRAARGNPWIFREVAHYLSHGELLPRPGAGEVCRTLTSHLEDMYNFYGEYMGVRIARKHIGWYCRGRRVPKPFPAMVNQAQRCEQQLNLIHRFFDTQKNKDLAA